jgi:hypothetical protein
MDSFFEVFYLYFELLVIKFKTQILLFKLGTTGGRRGRQEDVGDDRGT